MATYTDDQQVFCLNIISNLGSTFTGSAPQIADQTRAAIDNILSNADVIGQIGNWKRVWGPVVVAAEGRALNTMYIAEHADTRKHVVAIAGTDSKSLLDWFLEDFLIVTKVDWPYVSAMDPHPMTSLGTSIGLNVLTSMAEVNGDLHVHARDYLRNAAALDVVVTGHSLGGALAPAYALYLVDTINMWSTGGVSPLVSVLAAAGATPGDKAFSDYYFSKLGSTTLRVWNAHDVVPHGFEPDMLSEIAHIYEPAIKTPIAIKMAVDVLAKITAAKGYTQLMPGVPGFTTQVCDKASDFNAALLCNHICAYADHFKVSDFQVSVQHIMGYSAPFFSDGCN